jgi:protein-export membrane protein SecD
MQNRLAAVILSCATAAAVGLGAYAFVALAPAKTVALLPDWIPLFGRHLGLDELGGVSVILQADDPRTSDGPADWRKRTITLLRRRLFALGVRHPVVSIDDALRVRVEVAGYNDVARLDRALTYEIPLSLNLVDDRADGGSTSDPPGLVPPDDAVVPAAEQNCSPRCFYVLKRRPVATGEMVVAAAEGYDAAGNVAIMVRLDPRGKLRLAQATQDNIGGKLAVVFDGRVLTGPLIEGPIAGGSMQISGHFTQAQASDLALELNVGDLPTPLRIIAQRVAPPPRGAGGSS